MEVKNHITIQNVSKAYRQDSGPVFQALRNVSLSVNAGERVAIIGASGSGKTSILNLIGGLDQPDEGSIAVDGRQLSGMDDNALSDFRLKRIGYVFQSFNLLPHLTVEENIAVPLLLSGTGRRESRDRAREVAASVEMAGKVHRRPYELSGGEMQRVAIARAVVHDPILLLADEPTGNLDSHTGAVILTLLGRLNEERGVTLLIATHSDQCKRIADRIIGIRDGRIVSDEVKEPLADPVRMIGSSQV